MKNLGQRTDNKAIVNREDLGAGGVLDVQAPVRSNNNIVYVTIVDANGVAQIPLPADDVFGLIRRTSTYGTDIVDGVIKILYANEAEIGARAQQYKPIVPYKLNSAVIAALSDTNHITLDENQKDTAQSVLGVNTLSGASAPTTSTVGRIGQFFIETTNNVLYQCQTITDNGGTYTYTWKELSKADLSNVTYPIIASGTTTTGAGDRVVEFWISSDLKSWYRLWASGWKECGGETTMNADTTKSVTLPIEFATNTYIVTTCTRTTSNGDQYLGGHCVRDRLTVGHNSILTFYDYDHGHSILYYCAGV